MWLATFKNKELSCNMQSDLHFLSITITYEARNDGGVLILELLCFLIVSKE